MTASTDNARATSKGAAGSYANVNGLNIYYEIHGTGSPLVMLHGGVGGMEVFDQLLPALAENRQVISVELQAHGHTADIDRPLRYEYMADDIAALMKHLGVAKADLLGYSLGGGVAVQVAIRHPEVVRKLVLISAVFKRNAWYPENLAAMGVMNAEVAKTWIGSPMQEAYARVAPKPENWPVLIDKLGELLRLDYDWTADVAKLKMPMLLVAGDADGVRLDALVEAIKLLGGGKATGVMEALQNSQLAVLPGTSHLSIISRTDLLLPIIPPFLDAPLPDTA